MAWALGVDGRSATVFSRRTGPLRPYAGVAMRGMARGYAAGDSRDRGGARLRGRWVSGLPAAIRIGPRAARWKEADIAAFVDSRPAVTETPAE